MFIARVRGNVVATQKVTQMTGRKLLIVEPLRVSEGADGLAPTGRSFVAVDSVGAGQDDLVLITQGSSARMTEGTNDAPVDCVVIGVIDSVGALGKTVYRKSAEC
ncbi:MAG: Carbon dioxide concentrating mechanism protein CcmL [Phycisphaerae bacterium]|nr:Carbon dioxide concentrating mechanism protein CcmL [Phycisphaerae bacterium]